MGIEYDLEKDAANIVKHGLSLGAFRAFDTAPLVETDDRFDYGETRYRAFGTIDGDPHVIVYTVTDTRLRLISFRRSNDKEGRQYGRRRGERGTVR